MVSSFAKSKGCKLLTKEYKNQATEMLFQCKCGSEFYTTFANFKHNGKRTCNECSSIVIWTHSDVKDFIEKKSNCILLSTIYNNKSEKLKILCPCKRTFYMSFDCFRSGLMVCQKCSSKHRSKNITKSNATFVKEVEEKHGDEYFLLEPYKNYYTRISCRHNSCGHIWDAYPPHLLAGSGCPICASSKGEKAVGKALKNKKQKFRQEQTFKNLIGEGGNLLRFDFSVLENDNILGLIEYDGEFHFKEYYKTQNFDVLKRHDDVKNQYCKDNNIPLLRIPYWDFDNIDTIVNKWLDGIKNNIL